MFSPSTAFACSQSYIAVWLWLFTGFVKIRNARESFTSHKAICGALLAWQLRDSSELEEFDETLVHFIYSASIGLNHEGEKCFRWCVPFKMIHSAGDFKKNNNEKCLDVIQLL